MKAAALPPHISRRCNDDLERVLRDGGARA
jgi:hypothetical protein